MDELHYAYAVARIRCIEQNLLTNQDIIRLAGTETEEKAIAFLNGKGRNIDADDVSGSLEKRRQEAWELAFSLSGEDEGVFDSCLVYNDFHNLKAAIKAHFTDNDPMPLMMRPGTVSAETIVKAVRDHDFSVLPDYMRKPAEEARDTVMHTRNGRRADCMLDRAAMEASVMLADKSGDPLLGELARLRCDCADVKTAVRCALTGRDESFTELAVGGYGRLDKASLIKASAQGLSGIEEFLASNGRENLAEALGQGSEAFEKECDDMIIRLLTPQKYTPFGVGPVLAYCFAVETEVKNLRVILSCKRNDVPPEQTEKKVRESYV